MNAVDSLGSELVNGDKVTLQGEVISIDAHGDAMIRVVAECGSDPMVKCKSTAVTKQGDSDTLKAARRGFSST